MGLISLVSETVKSQLKVFLGLIWPPPDSINMVWWPGGHLGPYSTLEMCFGVGKWVKQGFGSLSGLDFIGF